MKSYIRDRLNDLRDEGWQVETDTETIYWTDIFSRSIAIREQIDPRQRGRRKPILLERDGEQVLIEWAYGDGDWLAYNADGDIYGAGELHDVLLDLKYGHDRT